MNYADLTIFMVGFIGFVASLIEIGNYISSPAFPYYVDLAILKKHFLS
jgi:hypothetical protein